MWIDYGERIAEPAEDLLARKRAVRDGRRQCWATASARRSAGGGSTAPAVWPLSYRSARPVTAVSGSRRRPGRRWRGRCAGRLKEAQAYLRERWGIAYCLDAMSKLFQRRKTKLKTGRARHRRADAAAQAALKKSARA